MDRPGRAGQTGAMTYPGLGAKTRVKADLRRFAAIHVVMWAWRRAIGGEDRKRRTVVLVTIA